MIRLHCMAIDWLKSGRRDNIETIEIEARRDEGDLYRYPQGEY